MNVTGCIYIQNNPIIGLLYHTPSLSLSSAGHGRDRGWTVMMLLCSALSLKRESLTFRFLKENFASPRIINRFCVRNEIRFIIFRDRGKYEIFLK